MSATQTGSSEQSFDLFQMLTEPEMALLRSRVGQQRIPAGETFIREGQPGDCLYIVREGQVEVRRAGRVLSRHGPSRIVGEMALLNREPRNADVLAVTDCVVDRLAAADFEEVCRQLSSLKLLLTRLVAHRLSWSGSDVVARKIGRYQVVGQLGAGSMSWVFRAVPAAAAAGEHAAEVALKMLPHPLVQRPRFLDRFRQEARIIEQLRHENIVALHETLELYGTVLLALEYVPGRDVREWIDFHGLPSVDDARRVVRAVARALRAAHARGITHRDVKPQNVMLRTDGVVKLMDFGIASFRDETDQASTISLTPAYAAPEMFAPRGGGPAGDFYSLGVMAYELVTGRLPFVGEELADWRRLHETVPPPALRDRAERLPGDLTRFVEAALIKSPAARLRAVEPCLQRWEQDPAPCVVARPPTLPSVVRTAGSDSATILSS